MRSDAELMRRAASGDKAAFEELVLRWRKPAESFALRLTGSREEAEEIVQDCFVRLWLYREKYKPDFSFKTFFFTLVKRRAVDELRKRNAAIHSEIPDEYEIPADGTAELAFIEKELADTVYDKIDELRKSDGDSFYLFAVCGLPAREIAARLGISEVNVRVRIYRTRNKLRRLLEKEGLL